MLTVLLSKDKWGKLVNFQTKWCCLGYHENIGQKLDVFTCFFT